MEQLTHPLIGQEILDQITAASSAYTLLSSPLLLETSQKELVDCVVVVDVPEQTQLERTITRDDNDEAQVKRIMAAQMQREDRLALADIVIDNSQSLEELDGVVEELHKEFLLRVEPAANKILLPASKAMDPPLRGDDLNREFRGWGSVGGGFRGPGLRGPGFPGST